MVHWIWLPIALFVGVFVGIGIMWYILRLRDPIRGSKRPCVFIKKQYTLHRGHHVSAEILPRFFYFPSGRRDKKTAKSLIQPFFCLLFYYFFSNSNNNNDRWNCQNFNCKIINYNNSKYFLKLRSSSQFSASIYLTQGLRLKNSITKSISFLHS